jgi:hypothetical protein
MTMLLTSLSTGHVVVGDDTEVSQARAALDQAAVEHVVVTTADGDPLAVLGAVELDALPRNSASLAGLADQFPSLFVLAGEPDELTDSELLDLAELLGREDLPYVLLEREGLAAGVIPRIAVAAALPLNLLDDRSERSGHPDVPALRYVCRRCTPPSFQMPRTPLPDGQPPRCRRVFFHGAMEPIA